MKFTGQVKVPEVDHPGVPATFVVGDGHAEVLLDGESLGKWSLYDVQATRLVASAFSVRLGSEEITFIADEPTEFAYKGVEHMAEKWARYKSMALPRRMLAVSRSRRGATPSRLEELRAAMLENINAPLPVVSPREPAVVEQLEVEQLEVEQLEVEQPKVETTAVETPVAAEVVQPIEIKPPESRLRLVPGPGLAAQAKAKTEPEPVPFTGSEAVTEPLLPLQDDRLEEPVDSAEEPSDAIIEPEVEMPVPEEVKPPEEAEVEPAAEVEPVPETTAATADEEPEVIEDAGGTSGPAEDEHEGGLLVDLGELDDSDEGIAEGPVAVPEPQPAAEPEPETVLAAASAERSSGIFGAVRSAFVRTRVAHEHDFVEAPGGIGITRLICSECGHVSIAVSD